MKLPQALMHRIMNDAIGHGVGRDEKGLYVEWNILQIECKTGAVSLWLNSTKVGEAAVFTRGLDMTESDFVQIQGLEGRLRVQVD